MNRTHVSWATLQPVNDEDGTRYAWTLVLDFDNDWQDWTVEGTAGGGVRFSLYVTDDMLPTLAHAVTTSDSQR